MTCSIIPPKEENIHEYYPEPSQPPTTQCGGGQPGLRWGCKRVEGLGPTGKPQPSCQMGLRTMTVFISHATSIKVINLHSAWYPNRVGTPQTYDYHHLYNRIFSCYIRRPMKVWLHAMLQCSVPCIGTSSLVRKCMKSWIRCTLKALPTPYFHHQVAHTSGILDMLRDIDDYVYPTLFLHIWFLPSPLTNGRVMLCNPTVLEVISEALRKIITVYPDMWLWQSPWEEWHSWYEIPCWSVPQQLIGHSCATHHSFDQELGRRDLPNEVPGRPSWTANIKGFWSLHLQKRKLKYLQRGLSKSQIME